MQNKTANSFRLSINRICFSLRYFFVFVHMQVPQVTCPYYDNNWEKE